MHPLDLAVFVVYMAGSVGFGSLATFTIGWLASCLLTDLTIERSALRS